MTAGETREAPPERLIDTDFPEGSPGAAAAADLRAAAAMPNISEAALARVSNRLAADARSTRNRGRPALHWRMAMVVVLVAVSVGGATTAAVWVVAPRLRARVTKGSNEGHMHPAPAPESLPPVPRRILRSTAAEASEAPPVEAPTSIGSETAAPPPSAPRRPLPRKLALSEPPARDPALSVPTTPPIPPPPAVLPDGPGPTPASRLALETELLRVALGRLRGEHDPRGALEILDQYAVRFPRGTLEPEAQITRVDALLALDRSEEAAAILDRLMLPTSPRGRELLVVRAELSARARRWVAAIADFTRALGDPALEPELTERALHGRAACHLRTRNSPAARADLEAYLRAFPNGRFAATARRTLRELDASPH